MDQAGPNEKPRIIEKGSCCIQRIMPEPLFSWRNRFSSRRTGRSAGFLTSGIGDDGGVGLALTSRQDGPRGFRTIHLRYPPGYLFGNPRVRHSTCLALHVQRNGRVSPACEWTRKTSPTGRSLTKPPGSPKNDHRKMITGKLDRQRTGLAELRRLPCGIYRAAFTVRRLPCGIYRAAFTGTSASAHPRRWR